MERITRFLTCNYILYVALLSWLAAQICKTIIDFIMAGKVNFERLFGEGYTRGSENNITAMLNYGYTILLSAVNQEIVSQGYITQLGIHHHSLLNDFNLSSDLMEPFRQFIDLKVIEKKDFEFNEYIKFELIDVLNKEIEYAGKTFHLRTAITKHVHDSLAFLNGERESIHQVVIPNEV